MFMYLVSITLVLLLTESRCLNVYVDPVHGFNGGKCNSAKTPCQSLQSVLADKHRENVTRYYLFDSGIHYLRYPVAKLKNLESVSFFGYGRMSIVHCSKNAGFAFETVKNIRFSNIKFVNCSISQNIIDQNDGVQLFRAAFSFYAPQKISMTLVNVSCSPNTTAVAAVYNTTGVNSFFGSVISNNVIGTKGQGFHLNFSISNGFSWVNLTCVHNTSSVFTFDNHVINNNMTTCSNNESILSRNSGALYPKCPPGFDCDGTKCVCVAEHNYLGSVSCLNGKAHLRKNSWIGLQNQTDPKNDTKILYQYYVASFCPRAFCSNESSDSVLPDSPKDFNRVVCGQQNRTGIMCGKCEEGFAVAVNTWSFHCIKCSNESITANAFKYIAAVYIPLTVFFMTIIFCNIRLTSAPANAFILYSQVITSTFGLSAGGEIPIFSAFASSEVFHILYHISYGIFDLEFIESLISPICLGQNSALHAIRLNYIVAIYPLSMILAVLLCFKIVEFCQSLYKKHVLVIRQQQRNASLKTKHRLSLKKAVLPAFAAFLLLSYNKFTTTTSHMVNYEKYSNATGHEIGVPRLYYAGHYTFTDPEYVRNFLYPACCFFSVFVVIPPLLLLDWPIRIFELCISKFGCVWRRYPSDKIHIFLDIFQGCYKNKMRFFAGFYFLFRFVINMSYVATQTWLGQYFIQQIACTVMISLLAICRPYNDQNKIFNTVDILIFTNLGLLNTLSFYQYSQWQSNPVQSGSVYTYQMVLAIVQCILVFLPMLYITAYIAWYLINPCRKKLRSQIRKKRLSQIKKSDVSSEVERIIEMQSSGTKLVEESLLLRRAQEQNRYRPSHFSPSVQSDTQVQSTSCSEDLSDANRTTHTITVPRYGSI